MIIWPDSNLLPQSQEWADKVEKEVTRIDKKTGGSGRGGASGSDGAAGPQGPQGLQGSGGEQGVSGADGTNGIDGIDGQQGIQGAQGETGAQGAQGNQGEQGFQGNQGIQGETGVQGVQGIQGDTGLQGETGDTGAQGSQGVQGVQGLTGDTGPAGDQGIQGVQGATGSTGPTGSTGAKGDQGLTGLSAYQVAQFEGFTGTEAEWLESLEAAGQPLVISDSTPSSNDQNKFWWNNTTGKLYLFYDEFWVEAVTGTTGPQGPAGNTNVKGIATLDFGAGSVSTETVITGYPQIASDTVIMVSMRIAETSEHTVDDLLTDPIRVAVKDLVVGVGFTIDGRMDNAEANGTYQINWLIT
jgi:hypothetical protein